MSKFEILQYNTHKSKDEVMATFLRDPEVLQASVIAIQEPWKNEYDDTTHQPSRLTHQLLYVRAIDGEVYDLYIHNIYNEPKLPTFDLLNRELLRIGRSWTIGHLILGDMNVHHPAWGGPGTKIDSEGTYLLEIMDRHKLELTTEEGIITWERG
ncbi:Endonuclease/exonuclease/phosphatase [Penicillium occitanis (nom. inval.)]|nr:Endonuclease/exonuclease/phosphatase [Penicillium occitanis (nom. inval.)]PCG88794.1 hypothetical protein PENOC_109370 [Penicillium occitanis (nom. inval.)]